MRKISGLAGAAVLTATLALSNTSAQAADIAGAGGSFPYPVYTQWADAYKKETATGLNYQSIGSGGGIKQIKAKTVTFGATDAPLSGKELDDSELAQFPMVMGGIVPVVNLAGVQPGDRVLDGPTLAKIFLGSRKCGPPRARMMAASRCLLPANNKVAARRGAARRPFPIGRRCGTVDACGRRAGLTGGEDGRRSSATGIG